MPVIANEVKQSQSHIKKRIKASVILNHCIPRVIIRSVSDEKSKQDHKGKAAKKALITGITGQDGSYLAEFLLSKDYEVHGIIRRLSSFNTQRLDHIYRDAHEHKKPNKTRWIRNMGV